MILLLLIFITGALTIILLTMLLNLPIFPRLRRTDAEAAYPSVSILIPARNEAAIIARTVSKHLVQDYPNFEVIVLDDKSDDGTGDIARNTGKGNTRLRVIDGHPLPPGWIGKSWACHHLAQAAQGEILIFTDADVQWQAGALRALIQQMQHSKVDLYTVWPTQITQTWPERLTVPLMALVILGYLPVVMTHYAPFAIFAAANGQCMAWRRKAYDQIGGHTIVANNVLDDVTLARAAKQAGFTLHMADGNKLITTRMYHDWASVRDGFAKNILAGYGNSIAALVLASIFHWLIFLVPYALLFTEYRTWALALIVIGLGVRALSAAFTRQRITDALLMPVSVILMTRIAWQAIYWHYTGGPRWKGRQLANQNVEGTSSW